LDRPGDLRHLESAPEDGTENRAGREGWGLEPRWLLLVILLVPLASGLFWWLGTGWFGSRLRFIEYQQFGTLLAIAVAGGYQLYFWVQRNGRHRRAICVKIPLDDKIPFVPAWIWPYSLL